MRPLSCLSEGATEIAIDASTAINLNATGRAADILSCFGGRMVVPDVVLGELEDGIPKGRRDAELTKRLAELGLVRVVSLSAAGWKFFEELVVGEAAETLDDGEAATIAYAVETGAMAIIDERKANRICAQRYKTVAVAATVDLLAHESVENVLGRAALSDAIFAALSVARMRVLPHHLDWVVGLIGMERASECASLPRSARQPSSKK
jgi:predicted nucleic acid-binding protein